MFIKNKTVMQTGAFSGGGMAKWAAGAPPQILRGKKREIIKSKKGGKGKKMK